MNATVSRPKEEDEAELQHLFHTVITYAFEQDGIGDRHEGIQEEVDKQMNFLNNDFENNGSDIFFLIARDENKILGTIALTKASDFLKQNIEIKDKVIPEVSSVYVLPSVQGKGIGSMLFREVLNILKQRNIDQFCMDGGYKSSQSFWINKLGNPDVNLKDYWGSGLDHMFWLRDTDSIQVRGSLR